MENKKQVVMLKDYVKNQAKQFQAATFCLFNDPYQETIHIKVTLETQLHFGSDLTLH